MPTPLPTELLDLLRRPSPCFIATVMPDGSPQLTQTWVTTDGEHIVVNVVDGLQKARNIARIHGSRSTSWIPMTRRGTTRCAVASSPPPPRAAPRASTRSRRNIWACRTRTSAACPRRGCVVTIEADSITPPTH